MFYGYFSLLTSLCFHPCLQEFILHKAARLNFFNLTPPHTTESHSTQNKILIPYDVLQAFHELVLNNPLHLTHNFILLLLLYYLLAFPPVWVLSIQPSFLHHSGRINASAVKILSRISLMVLSLECFAPESHEVSLLQGIQFSAEYLHPTGFLWLSCPKQHLPDHSVLLPSLNFSVIVIQYSKYLEPTSTHYNATSMKAGVPFVHCHMPSYITVIWIKI